jgi:hypothetical protein
MKNKFTLLLMLLLFLSSCGILKKSSYTPPPSGQVITEVLNTVIQSEPVQNYQFVIESGCTPSVLNDLEFCNSVVSKNDITTSVVDQACVDACDVYMIFVTVDVQQLIGLVTTVVQRSARKEEMLVRIFVVI